MRSPIACAELGLVLAALAADAASNVYVLDTENNRVQKFRPRA